MAKPGVKQPEVSGSKAQSKFWSLGLREARSTDGWLFIARNNYFFASDFRQRL